MAPGWVAGVGGSFVDFFECLTANGPFYQFLIVSLAAASENELSVTGRIEGTLISTTRFAVRTATLSMIFIDCGSVCLVAFAPALREH